MELEDYATEDLLKEVLSRVKTDENIAKEPIPEVTASGAEFPQRREEVVVGVHEPVRAVQGYPIICSECKGEATVPFKPNPKRPVLCIDCYRARG